MFFFDSTIIILLPAIIIAAIAQMKIKSSFKKYPKVNSVNGYTGAQVARMLLDAAGLFDIPVEIVQGKLTDHYDPTKRVMRLSSDVYNGISVASIGVAAHETGHALQDKEKYVPLKLRNAIVPAVNFSSNASWVLFLIGIIFSIHSLINVGIILFSAVVLFQLVTLPVEFNASSRAIKVLESRNILYGDEIKGAKSVLSAAAMTYVAATLMAISQLIRLVIISRDR
ncbi:zinc metallopeptidase [Clostridium lacusfryxellense]|uniref:zinc metallopeptidase n=1 Tax=Clostridium lacusfryxellense TaxID=205328 RepID=UPI001C0C7630|nr:zinc metallopeptidase [Clostridium lacusfryxellense]MBU3110718.1 zinc metallopeptidase [Clostridium lacusfryxellense]